MSTPLNTIFSWFETGDFPTQSQFQASWSSFWHKDDFLPISQITGLTQVIEQMVSSEALQNHINDSNAHTGYLAKLDATNLTASHVNDWKDKLGVGEIPANVALVDMGENQSVFNKEQITSICMLLENYVNSNGEILAEKIEALGLTRLKKAAENTIQDFAANSAAYEFEESDIIAIPSTDPEPFYSLYFYIGGDKADTDNYLNTGISNITISMVEGLNEELNKKVDKPLMDGRFLIKRESGVTTTELIPEETLQSVVNRGNDTTKEIVFNKDQGRAGELNFNKTSYSYYFGNHSNNNAAYYTVAIGYNTLSAVTTGTSNVGIGSYALELTTTGKMNTAVGVNAGQKLTTGQYNAYFGWAAGNSCTTGESNTMLGDEAGNRTTTGYKNTFVGMAAGYFNTTGNLNTLIGWKANNQSNMGDKNIVIGVSAGSGVTGSNNVLIGTGAGMNDGAIGNKLIIHGNQTLTGYSNTVDGNFGSFQQGTLSRALITGDFVDRWVRINGASFTVGTPASAADDIIINPLSGIRGSKLYAMSSNFDYVQRGYLFDLYYNKLQVDSLLSRVYSVMGSVADFSSLPPNDGSRKIGEVWNLLDTGENYVWVDNLNNTTSPGWDKLSGMVDLSAYATVDYVDENTIPRGGTSIGKPVLGHIEVSNADDPSTVETLIYRVNSDGDTHSVGFFPSGILISSYDFSGAIRSTLDVNKEDGILASAYNAQLKLDSTGASLRNFSDSETKGIYVSPVADEPVLIEHTATGGRGLSSGTYFGNYAQDNDYVQAKYVKDKIAEAKPYKVYTCLLAASGSPALPFPVVLENTIGDIVWSRNNVGEFFGTLDGAFPINKVWTVCSLSQSNGGIGAEKHIISARLDDDRVFFKLTNANDGSAIDLTGQFGSLEIRIYN